MLNRQFGLEFEHISKVDCHTLANEGQRAGLIVDHYATGHARCPEHCYSGWQFKVDGSITPQGNFGYGIELVSPPLTFKQSKQVQTALALARKHGAINASCGLHVHIHAPELSNAIGGSSGNPMRTRLEQTWMAIENIMFTYVPLSRRASDYCRSGISYSERYQAMNLSPLASSRRTVEFRMHSATLNANKALSFVALCMAFVDFVVRDTKGLVTKLNPDIVLPVAPKLIKTRKGGEFHLLRDQKQWLIESPNLNVAVPSLKEAFDAHKKVLQIAHVKHYLPAFHYPHYGNAMTDLCERFGVNGIFRGYLEDRYDHMLVKHGPMTEAQLTRNIVEDEADYYNEPDYVAPDVIPGATQVS